MAKLTTTFIKVPVSIDAKVLVGGKKKNASATPLGKSYKSVITGINRLGSALASSGNQKSETTEKLTALNLGLTEFGQKRKDLASLKDEYLDLVTKREEERSTTDKPGKPKPDGGTPDPDVQKSVKKDGKGLLKNLGMLGKFFGGLRGILGKAFFLTAGLAALKWFADPANAKKVDNIVKGLSSVFGFIWNVVKVVSGLVIGGIVNLGSGLGKIFGSGGDPKQILGGFGDLLQSIPGIFTLGFLANPIGAFKAIIKILTSWREPRDKEPEKPDDNKKKPEEPDDKKNKQNKKDDGPDSKKKGPKADTPDAKTKKPGFFDSIRDRAKKFGDSVTSGVKRTGEFVTEQGKRLSAAGGEALQSAKKRFGEVAEVIGENWKKLSEGTKAAIGWIQKNVDKVKKWGKTALFDWLSKQSGVLGKVGKALPDLMKKLGKYLPFVGDIAGFVMDIMAGIDWRRALIRALTGMAVDGGFTALMAALGLAAPFTGGASGIAATALYVAYMGADLAVGGFGVLLGDPIADALGIPMHAGESSENATIGTMPSLESAEKETSDAISKKDPDWQSKIAEKEAKLKGNSAEDGGILSPKGKVLPFGAATTSENKDDIRDLIGFGTSYSNNSLRGLLKQAIEWQKIYADTTYDMKEKGFFEKGLEAFKDFAGKIAGSVMGAGEKALSFASTFLGNVGAKLGIGDGEYGEAPLKSAAEAAGIKGKELAAFLAQMSHESGGFKYKTEIGGGKDSYDGGKRYKGRGYIQLTHKYNYAYYGKKLGLDLVNKPELAEGGESAAKIALLYWMENVRPRVGGDWDNVFLHSRAINYPAAKSPSDVNGMKDRQERYDAYVKKLGLEGKSSGGKIARWQAQQKEPQLSLQAPEGGITPFNVPGWSEFALGGEYKNGQIPKSALRKVNGHGGSVGYGYLHSSVADQFQSMIDAAKKDGHNLGINSTYRSYADQVRIKKSHGALAATPGTSNHGWGQAADLYYTNAGYKWLWANASKFGFKPLSGWGLSPSTPDKPEAWHWENTSGGGAKGDGVKTEQATDIGDGSSPAQSPSGEQKDQTTEKTKVDPFAALTAAVEKYRSALGSGPATPSPSKDGLEGKSMGGEINLQPQIDIVSNTSHALNVAANVLPDVPIDVRNGFGKTSHRLKETADQLTNVQIKIENVQITRTQDMLDKSRVIVAEKKAKVASTNIINTTSQVRQQVISGTNSFAVHAPRKYTKFF